MSFKDVFFFFFFFLNLSFNIAMSGRAGVGRAGFGFTFWLTFFQSCRLPLFFSGLLSYLVGMKRRSVGVSHARETTHTSFIMYLSPLMSEVYLLVNLFEKPAHIAIRCFSLF